MNRFYVLGNDMSRWKDLIMFNVLNYSNNKLTYVLEKIEML